MKNNNKKIDRLDFFEGYIIKHRDNIIKDLASEESKNNHIIKLINEVRLTEMDHLLECIEDMNKRIMPKQEKKETQKNKK